MPEPKIFARERSFRKEKVVELLNEEIASLEEELLILKEIRAYYGGQDQPAPSKWTAMALRLIQERKDTLPFSVKWLTKNLKRRGYQVRGHNVSGWLDRQKRKGVVMKASGHGYWKLTDVGKQMKDQL